VTEPTDAHERDVTLRDGRTLGYLDIGDPDGLPVLSCHGGLSCGLDVAPGAASAARHGVRILAPDRPGIGRSTRQPGRAPLDWADDVADFTEQLGIERFAVLGWSLGGLYAQACAYRFADRIPALSLVASTIPASWSGMRDEVNRMDRVFMKLSEHGTAVERCIFHLMHTTAHHMPKAFAKSSHVSGDLAAELPSTVAAGLTDVKAVVDDYRVMAGPWGFEPADIAVPTQIWQGDADDLVPESWGRRLAAAIPDANLTVVPGAGHFLWYDRWDDIFEALTTASPHREGTG
jgi:pimeloyl-ACP methyl ester carboxylesterase